MEEAVNIYLVKDYSYPIIKRFLANGYTPYTDLVENQDIGNYNIISIINGIYNRPKGISIPEHYTRIIISERKWNIVRSYITIPIKVFRFNQELNIEDIVKPVIIYGQNY